jgi:hypothetical protein
MENTVDTQKYGRPIYRQTESEGVTALYDVTKIASLVAWKGIDAVSDRVEC